MVYYDGQFDDARLLIHLAMTAADHGAVLLNYCPATGLVRDAEGYINGVTARDDDTGEDFTLQARIVVNATGVFTDSIRRMADPAAEPLMVTSQGIHLVFDRSFLKRRHRAHGSQDQRRPRPLRHSLARPRRGRNHRHACRRAQPRAAPARRRDRIRPRNRMADSSPVRPRRADVLAVFVGLRPLVKGDGKTSALSRDHVIHVDTSGLLTITGGKWTTYRHMAEDTVDHAITLGKLPDLACPTRNLRIHGYLEEASLPTDSEEHLAVYGTDADAIRDLRARLPALAAQLHPALPYTAAEVVWAARDEMARTVEDVLARRTRALFLNANAAIAMAEPVAKMLASHFGRDQSWIAAQVNEFTALAQQYRVVA